MPNDQDIARFLHRLADAAGEAILPHFRAALAVEDKGGGRFDPVTIADRAGEAAMRALIAAEFPTDGILGEEYGIERGDAERLWVLDPIDGTRSFISGIPLWGVLIGLQVTGKASIGMMAQPYTGERFFGTGTNAVFTGPHGSGALAARRCGALSDAVMFTTDPALFSAEERPFYDRLSASVRLNRYSADCYAYCMLASGQADIVVESGLNPYDIVALVPIIEGAGGRVTTWDGGAPEKGGRILACGDPELHEKVLAELNLA